MTYLECNPTPTQIEIVRRRQRFLADIDSKAVKDYGIDLKRKHKPVEVVAPEIVPIVEEIIPLTQMKLVWNILDIIERRENKAPPNFHKHIKRIVAVSFNKTVMDLESRRRNKDDVIPRHVAIYFCRTLTPKSLPEIGRIFGGIDHSSTLHAVRKMPERMKADAVLCQQVAELEIQFEDEITKWRAGGEI